MTDLRRARGNLRSRARGLGLGALASLIALLVTLPNSALPANATSTTVGYVGCSLTWMSVAGYHADGGTRLWPPLPGYGGGEIPQWFQDLADPTPKYWPIFQQTLVTNPASTFWIEGCFQTKQIGPSNVAQAEAVVRHVRALVPGATIYFSAMNGWDPPDSCATASSAAVAASQQVTDALVAEGLVLRGPLMPVLPASHTVDGCHPDVAGRALLGQPLLGFFDGATPSPTGPVFTQTPTDPSGPQVTFAFTAAGSGLTFRCSLDGAAASTCVPPVNLLGLSNGVHTYSVRDKATGDGSFSPPSTFSWSVDAVPPPAPTFVSTPTALSTSKVKFSFTDAEVAATFTCSLDGAIATACVSPAAILGLSAGSHTFRVRAVDEVGNRSRASGFSWTVSATAS